GCVLDLLIRELEAVHCRSFRNWQDIVQQVRSDLWETATGEELFGFPHFWSRIRIEAQKGIESEKYIASVARTNPGHLFDMKLSEAYALPRRPKEERNGFLQSLAADLKSQLDVHGDPKLKDSRSSAIEFTKGTARVMQAIDAKGGDPLDHLPAQYGVPKELITPEMTIGELGELGNYVAQLKVITGNLPACYRVTIKDVPIGALPSIVLDQRLTRIQQKTPRVTGSNIGDRRLAAMALYADGLDVDKRTHDYLRQVQNADPSLKAIMRPYFRGSDYATIPQRFD
ncbi:MAG: hypothetical protein JWM11_1944, partial [Planctomycetaceae bacterium]|nr:hypothetical protein [Planctomycetaceae bacterium]